MPITKIIRPEYAQQFRCVGAECEDTCCAGWRVDIDRATFEKYQTIPAGRLRQLIDENIVRVPESNGNTPGQPFARVRMPPSQDCPFHNGEHLCQIQVEHGAEFLSHTCATFPRNLFVIDGVEDRTLTLSCPEAARIVLLNPALLETRETPRSFSWDEKTWGYATADGNVSKPLLRNFFWALRELSIQIARNRKYPLWQRLFLLGTLARRVDAVVTGELDRTFPELLKDFSAAVKSGKLRASIEAIPADLALQLNMVMQLVHMRIANTALQPRLKEVLNEFVLGVGYPDETTVEGQSRLYSAAYDQYYAPFMAKAPHILENLLSNLILRSLFPVGTKLFEPHTQPEPAKEFAKMATEFGLIKGVLIGVAGHYKAAFHADHVVKAVQVITKHFEHNREFLKNAQKFLEERKLDNAHGLTMLVRN